MAEEIKKINVLILHHSPLTREKLRQILDNDLVIFEASWVSRALQLSRQVKLNLVIAEASQGDYSSLAGIISPDIPLFLISNQHQDLIKALKSWPHNRLVEIQPWPLEAENIEIFRRRVRLAIDNLQLRALAQKIERGQLKAADNQFHRLEREIHELKNFFKQKVLKELENRLAWEIKYLLAEKEKEKIETILKKIYAANDVNSLIDCVQDIREIIMAGSLTFYILEESEAQGKYLKPLVFEDAFLSHPDFARYNVPLSAEDFAAFVARTGQEINISSPENDPRFSSRYREQLRTPLKNLLAVPIMHVQDVIGVIEAYNKQTKETAKTEFTLEDQRLLKTISEHISMAMTKLNLIQYDPLTGLLRPEPFFEKILQKIQTQSKRRVDIGHCAMVMGDVDWFKNYNDLHGHEAGNRLLRQLATVLKASIREEDLSCRYGGEEFLFFLSGVKSLEEALLLTERIRRHVEQHYFPYQEDQPRKNLTMSFGVTILPQEKISPSLTKEDLKKLVAEADIALAEAKGKRLPTGAEELPLKNRICAYWPEDERKQKWTLINFQERKQIEEKRKHHRHFISTPMLIFDESGIKVTKTVNLSLGGAKICLSSDLPLGKNLNLTIILEDKACQLNGNVVYKEKAADSPPLFHAGIEFSFPSPSIQKILEDYLNTMASKSSAIN